MPDPDQDMLWRLISERGQGVLATLHRDGRPQLSNVLYLVEAGTRTVRISTTATRLKARNLRRDPRAALHVSGDDFWAYAVAEGAATLSAVAAAPSDEAVSELRALHTAFYGKLPDSHKFAQEMIANQRLVIRLVVDRLYGVVTTAGPRPIPRHSEGSA